MEALRADHHHEWLRYLDREGQLAMRRLSSVVRTAVDHLCRDEALEAHVELCEAEDCDTAPPLIAVLSDTRSAIELENFVAAVEGPPPVNADALLRRYARGQAVVAFRWESPLAACFARWLGEADSGYIALKAGADVPSLLHASLGRALQDFLQVWGQVFYEVNSTAFLSSMTLGDCQYVRVQRTCPRQHECRWCCDVEDVTPADVARPRCCYADVVVAPLDLQMPDRLQHIASNFDDCVIDALLVQPYLGRAKEVFHLADVTAFSDLNWLVPLRGVTALQMEHQDDVPPIRHLDFRCCATSLLAVTSRLLCLPLIHLDLSPVDSTAPWLNRVLDEGDRFFGTLTLPTQSRDGVEAWLSRRLHRESTTSWIPSYWGMYRRRGHVDADEDQPRQVNPVRFQRPPLGRVCRVIDHQWSWDEDATADYSDYVQTTDMVMSRHEFSVFNVILPPNLVALHNQVFSRQAQLQRVDLSTLMCLRSIGERTFEATGLKHVTLPPNLTSIGDYAFASCPLETLEIPARDMALRRLGLGAFHETQLAVIDLRRCIALQRVEAFQCLPRCKAVYLPPSPTLDKKAFIGCAQVTELMREHCFGNLTVQVGAFKSQSAFCVIDLSACCIDELPVQCFADCSSLVHVNLINTGLRALPLSCFYRCGALETVHLPLTCTDFGGHAFRGCKKLKRIDWEAQTVQREDLYLPYSNCTLKWGAFSDCGFVDADLSNQVQLTEIPSQLFAECAALQRCVLPRSVTVIDQTAFGGCTALTSLNLSDCLDLETIDMFAFSATAFKVVDVRNCTKLQSIDPTAFDKCNTIERLLVPPAFNGSVQALIEHSAAADRTVFTKPVNVWKRGPPR